MSGKQIKLAMHSLGVQLKTEGDKVVAYGWCLHRFRNEKGREISTGDITVSIGENRDCAEIAFTMGKGISLVKGVRLNRFTITFGMDALSELDIQNKIFINYGDESARLVFNVLDRNKGRFRTSRVVSDGRLACYMKQSVLNATYMTVREPQIYDRPSARVRVWLAWVLAKLWPKNDIIFLFEKECSKYEESGSVLYEKLIDEGYNNAYFVVNQGNPAIDNLDEKYRKNLIYKDSFRHLLYFFKSKVFIGSETMSHAMQLRASDKRIVKKTRSKDISYVFLQHGVMYMISLDAKLRSAFRQTDLNLYRVVVSSQLEADHFTELGGFEEEELYITGLAKFDRSIRYDGADKIVIMPTWRRWEANQARDDFEKTGYCRMIERIVDAVPDNLKDKIVILPHPLMQQAIGDSEHKLSRYIATKTHDETLRECSLLITDYSSIAYDAFYRGCNVIFYWEEKDYCLECYGEGTKLMLTEEGAFGDVCYKAQELEESIINSYDCAQKDEYVEKYRKIVSFSDGNNAARIIAKLKEDKVIK